MAALRSNWALPDLACQHQVKRSRFQQSEGRQVLSASSAGTRQKLYSRLYRLRGSESLRAESQTGCS
jgi:hypothetical protein